MGDLFGCGLDLITVSFVFDAFGGDCPMRVFCSVWLWLNCVCFGVSGLAVASAVGCGYLLCFCNCIGAFFLFGLVIVVIGLDVG